MKKLIIFLAVMCLIVPCFGFKDVSSATLVASSGSVREAVVIKYNQQDAALAGATFAHFDQCMEVTSQKLKIVLEQKIAQRLQALPNINALQVALQVNVATAIEQTTDGAQLTVMLNFGSKKVWDYFRDTQSQTTTQGSLFTTTTTTTSKLLMASFADGLEQKTTVQYVFEFTLASLEQAGLNVISLAAPEYSFSYVSTTKRLHSNATSIRQDAKTGYIYHMWNCTFQSEPMLTLWQVRANYITWYLLALGLTAVFGAAIWLYAMSKSGKKPNVPQQDASTN